MFAGSGKKGGKWETRGYYYQNFVTLYYLRGREIEGVERHSNIYKPRGIFDV